MVFLLSFLPTTIAIVLSTSFIQLVNCEEFHPITEDISFRTNFRIQTFINAQPESTYEVFEQYQHNLASANIWITKFGGDSLEPNVRRFLYNGDTRRDIEVISELTRPNEIYLYENGGSSSYASEFGYDNNSLKISYVDSDRIDSMLFANRLSTLDLDLFMSADCEEKIRNKLYYIRGFSRILHLIECRRKELIRYSALTDFTRGTRKTVYSSSNLPILSKTSSESLPKFINVSVSTEHRFDVEEDKVLPKCSVPISISISFGPQVLMIINCYQFEIVDLGEHLSESSLSESDFILPIGRGISQQLSPAISTSDLDSRVDRLKWNSLKEFNFRASLTGSHFPFEDPIELLVFYDGHARVLGRQISTVDRSETLGDTYRSHTTRLVYDGESNFKFHIQHSNRDYHFGSEDGQDTISAANLKWHPCVSDSLKNGESEALDTGGSEVFDLDGALFMGMAIVRGVPCYVFERRLYKLPLWMGLSTTDFAPMDFPQPDNKIIATLYESVAEIGVNTFDDEDFARSNRDGKSSKLVRLLVNIVAPNSTILLSYKLEIFTFDWSIKLSNDELALFHVGQECFFNNPDSRHLDMKFELEPTRLHEALRSSRDFYALKDDNHFRDTVISHALFQTFSITQSQQANMETYFHSTADPAEVILHAKLSVYELSVLELSSKKFGYAKDLSVGSFQLGSWSIGTTSISFEECRWRAAHTLNSARLDDMFADNSEQQTKDSADDDLGFRMFMYCPSTLHCVLGDKRWKPIHAGKPVIIDYVLEYPVPANSPKKCLITFLSVARRRIPPHSLDTGGRMLLDWMSAKQDQLKDTVVELNVESDEPIPMKISKLRLSSIIDGNGGLGGGNYDWPLRGVGYEPMQAGLAREMEPLSVKSLAQCSHTCLLLHDCNSYSVCHNGAKFDCLLSTVNWTDPIKMTEASRLAQKAARMLIVGSKAKGDGGDGSNKSRSTGIELELQLDGQQQQLVEVIKLRPSNLCSLHKRQHLDLFQLEDSGRLLVFSNVDYLLHAEEVNECARFCLERAHLVNSMLAKVSSSDKAAAADSSSGRSSSSKRAQRVEKAMFLTTGLPSGKRLRTCTSFKFSKQSKLCELFPQQNMTSLRLQLVESHRLQSESQSNLQSQSQLNKLDKRDGSSNGGTFGAPRQQRWLRSISMLQTRALGWRPTTIAESDHYELIYEQLFVAYFGKRLSVVEEVEADNEEPKSPNSSSGSSTIGNQEWQIRYENTGVHECARLCLSVSFCRSFDVLTERPTTNKRQLASLSKNEVCLLNMLSLFELWQRLNETTIGKTAKLPLRLELQASKPAPVVAPSGVAQAGPIVIGEFGSAAAPVVNEELWWSHYEPSELALYAMSDSLLQQQPIDQSSAGLVSSMASQQIGIFISTTPNAVPITPQRLQALSAAAIDASSSPSGIGNNDSGKKHNTTAGGSGNLTKWLVCSLLVFMLIVAVVASTGQKGQRDDLSLLLPTARLSSCGQRCSGFFGRLSARLTSRRR